MKKTYQKPAIDMEALESEQAIAAASNPILLNSSDEAAVNADEAAARMQTSSDESTSTFSVWDD